MAVRLSINSIENEVICWLKEAAGERDPSAASIYHSRVPLSRPLQPVYTRLRQNFALPDKTPRHYESSTISPEPERRPKDRRYIIYTTSKLEPNEPFPPMLRTRTCLFPVDSGRWFGLAVGG